MNQWQTYSQSQARARVPMSKSIYIYLYNTHRLARHVAVFSQPFRSRRALDTFQLYFAKVKLHLFNSLLDARNSELYRPPAHLNPPCSACLLRLHWKSRAVDAATRAAVILFGSAASRARRAS